MPVWSTTDINRFADTGEQSFVIDYPCIIDRLALDIVAGTSEYTLPDYCVDIRRITWQGIKLDPLPQRMFRDAFQGSGSQQGRPYWYIYNNIGKGVIKLFPAPAESIATTSTGLFTTAIETHCIVEFFRTSDYDTYIIPEYFCRRLLKAYVLRQCFSMENQGQNKKVSKYFDDKWSLFCKLYGELLGDLNNKPRKLVIGSGTYQGFPGTPLLPIDRFGVSVYEGE